jgi:dihydropteroate synthase
LRLDQLNLADKHDFPARSVLNDLHRAPSKADVPPIPTNWKEVRFPVESNEMWQVVAQARAGYVAMHMQGRPETMQLNPVYEDVVREVGEFFSDRLRRLEQAGVRAEQVVLDVGFGFGKTLDHNLALLAALKRFTRFQRPLLLGASRKSFIGKLLGLGIEERLPAALACSCWAVHSGAHVVRTHDVAATVAALRMTEAILARSKA